MSKKSIKKPTHEEITKIVGGVKQIIDTFANEKGICIHYADKSKKSEIIVPKKGANGKKTLEIHNLDEIIPDILPDILLGNFNVEHFMQDRFLERICCVPNDEESLKKNNEEIQKNVIDTINNIIKYKNVNIILETYIAMYRIHSKYNETYGSRFFNRLFLALYIRFPRTIISLFSEYPNYQFFYYFSGFLYDSIRDMNSDHLLLPLSKLYTVIVSLYSYQLKKDYDTIKDNKGDLGEISISNAAIYSPSINSNETTYRGNILRCHISAKLFGKGHLREYDNIISVITFNMFVILKKNKSHIFNNCIHPDEVKKCCFKMTKANFKKEIVRYISK